MSTQTLPQPRTASLGAKAGKVARAALALLLFAEGALFALLAVTWAWWQRFEPDLLHVPYPWWAGAVLYLLLLGAAAGTTLAAGAALWQVAWGRAHLVGSRRNASLWGAVVANGVLIPGIMLVTAAYDPAADAPATGDAVSGSVFFLALAACIVVFGLRLPFHWPGWRPLALSAVMCVALFSGVVLIANAQHQALIDSISHIFPPRPTTHETCVGQPNDGCPSRAATFRGGVVAWMPMPATYESEFDGTLPVSGHRAFEALQSTADGARLKLVSNSTPGPNWYCRDGECTHHRDVRAEGRPVTLSWGFSKGSGDFLVADWSRDGVHFTLDAENPYHPVDRDWFVGVLRSIRYASP